MTTTMTVNAHCDDSVEIKITVEDDYGEMMTTTLQNGESVNHGVYDNRKITVLEVEKTNVTEQDDEGNE